MRVLEAMEVESVTGGFNIHINLGIVEIDMTGKELSAGHNWAVNKMAGFFTWWDPAGYYR